MRYCFFRNYIPNVQNKSIIGQRNEICIRISMQNLNLHKYCILLIGVVLEITIKFHTSLSKLMHCCLPLEFRHNLYKIDSCIRRAIHSLRLFLTEAELMNGSIRKKHQVLLKKCFANAFAAWQRGSEGRRAKGVLVYTP